MMERILSRLASLRFRLIVTYLLMTVISFGALFLLLLQPVEGFILKREEELLRAVGITLGSTIRSPVEASQEAFLLDLKWTQRRCHLYLCDNIPGMRIRVLDARGYALTDSGFTSADWSAWDAERARRPSLSTRSEVREALHGAYRMQIIRRRDPVSRGAATAQSGSTMYLALPVLRTDPVTRARRVAFIMYLERPLDLVTKNLRDLGSLIMISMVISLCVVLAASILLASNLAAGVQAATRIAQAFAAGQTGQRMRESGRDEVGQLGRAFNRMAEALQRQEQLRRNLLADVSHELRTPLTAIAGCADTLADGALREDPAAAEHFLDIIVRESERLQRLVSDILELSRLQSGTVEMPRQPLPIVPLIEDAVEVARLHARQDHVTIEWTPPARALLVLGNADRLTQALRNILDNACHHTPSGKRVTVTVEATDSNEVVVGIRDEGTGIPPNDLPWVFDRFYRAGKGGKPGGTGLGLAIVREICLAHQGSITVESAPEQGAAFFLHLPGATAERGAPAGTLHG